MTEKPLSSLNTYLTERQERHYTDSSSCKMALVLTVLIGVSAGVLSYFINLFNTGTLIDRVGRGYQI